MLCLLLLAACGSEDPLDEALRRGELLVVTRNGSATYYQGREGPDGFEHALGRAFAEHLGLAARFLVRDSIAEVMAAVREGEGHVGAAGLTRTEARAREHRFGPDYKEVRQQVVCHKDGPSPGSPAELVGIDLLVLAGSSYEERLATLKGEHPALRWRTVAGLSTDEILEQVWSGEAQCAVADSNLVDINRPYYPELRVAFDVSEAQQLAWVIPPGADKLAAALEDWFAHVRASGVMNRINERYYGHVTRFDYVDLRSFVRRLSSRLPRFEALFREAGRAHGLPWELLAALSYQESHWDPRARSPTGVRGMMMLTGRTARSLGVSNRLDPRQSIMGGARYLAQMLRRVPAAVTGPDRLWFALAAYNVGLGHVRDARTLARRLGRNPDTWHELKSVLPLLSRKRYYRTLKHGYARGGEPVRYVERIRNYLDILKRRTPGAVPA